MIAKKDLIIVVLLTFCLSVTLFRVLPIGSQGVGDYDPWYDVNDDGEIDMMDVAGVARKFGTEGESFEAKAGLTFDSGWINIADKRGEYFNITHNLNSTNIMVDIQGKATPDGGPHQRNLGRTGYIPSGWNRTYGGTDSEVANCIVKTCDGGYVIAGYTESFGAGDKDFWLVKTDRFGNQLWNRTYGGTYTDHAYSIVQTSDGGYALAGITHQFDISQSDSWLVKTDENGNVEWNKTYGGSERDETYSVVETHDGGYALAGRTESFSIGPSDFWLVKTDAAGNMKWNKTYDYASEHQDIAYCLVETCDGGLALAGGTGLFEEGYPPIDFWLVKTDKNGNVEWGETYGIDYWSVAYCLLETSDGGYALAGYTGYKFQSSFGLVKADQNGTVQWKKGYGGGEFNYDYASWAVETCDRGYALVGRKDSPDTLYDCMLVRTDRNGNQLSNKMFRGGVANCILENCDGGYALAGARGGDFWLFKTNQDGSILEGWLYDLIWTESSADTITLYRGLNDNHWNYVRVRIWKVREKP